MTDPHEPAFIDHPVGSQVWTGLTKHEYFAAMAMQGDLAAGCGEPGRAKYWVKQADALIAELNKEEKS